jgi:hypothetical protein
MLYCRLGRIGELTGTVWRPDGDVDGQRAA